MTELSPFWSEISCESFNLKSSSTDFYQELEPELWIYKLLLYKGIESVELVIVVLVDTPNVELKFFEKSEWIGLLENLLKQWTKME